jgi:hypothetical protein
MDLECVLDVKVQNWIQLNIVDIIMVATYHTLFTFLWVSHFFKI